MPADKVTTPDPNQPPTVASFGPPKPVPTAPASTAAPIGAPPQMSPTEFSRLPEEAAAKAAAAARMLSAQPGGANPEAVVRMVQELVRPAPKSAPQQAPQPVAARPQEVSQAERLRLFQYDGNRYGERIAGFLNTHLPGVSIGITVEASETGAVSAFRLASIVVDDSDEQIVLAEISAEPTALGEALYALVQQTNERLNSPAAVVHTAY